jgi:membrane-bound lytic murein transglycosylase A
VPIATTPTAASTPAPAAPANALPRAAEPASRDDLATATLDRPRGRWVAASWSDLPDWGDDRLAEFWPVFLRSCERPTPAWLAACARARLNGPGPAPDDPTLRAWIQRQLRPYRVESAERNPAGLATGYFEPLVDASRVARPGFRVPLYAPPPDLASRKPYWTRHQIETLPAAQRSLRGHEIAWLRDPLDALVLQIQGSGRLAFANGRGDATTVRVAYAAHNDQPYLSIGRWLIDQGELRASEASWPAIRAWARQHPSRVDEMIRSNPRVVFFREEPLPDPSIGPKGAQGVALTPGRSIAVDPQSVPYGTPVWLDTTEPLSTRPLRRLAMAQDTGSAIVGAVRADYFWGWGDDAEAQAGRMKQPLRMWVLWPAQGADERVGLK